MRFNAATTTSTTSVVASIYIYIVYISSIYTNTTLYYISSQSFAAYLQFVYEFLLFAFCLWNFLRGIANVQRRFIYIDIYIFICIHVLVVYLYFSLFAFLSFFLFFAKIETALALSLAWFLFQ